MDLSTIVYLKNHGGNSGSGSSSSSASNIILETNMNIFDTAITAITCNYTPKEIAKAYNNGSTVILKTPLDDEKTDFVYIEPSYIYTEIWDDDESPYIHITIKDDSGYTCHITGYSDLYVYSVDLDSLYIHINSNDYISRGFPSLISSETYNDIYDAYSYGKDCSLYSNWDRKDSAKDWNKFTITYIDNDYIEFYSPRLEEYINIYPDDSVEYVQRKIYQWQMNCSINRLPSTIDVSNFYMNDLQSNMSEESLIAILYEVATSYYNYVLIDFTIWLQDEIYDFIDCSGKNDNNIWTFIFRPRTTPSPILEIVINFGATGSDEPASITSISFKENTYFESLTSTTAQVFTGYKNGIFNNNKTLQNVWTALHSGIQTWFRWTEEDGYSSPMLPQTIIAKSGNNTVDFFATDLTNITELTLSFYDSSGTVCTMTFAEEMQ